ncbi:DUF4241 domain-containing protein [Thermomonospora cellulosilytica]|uniref:DUF4241 domain-containing protein n=1 Tax=Thermomonospora cellulosilytica TaxID=1411118 RepID=A0A7W3MWB4_9ACTN|nr:DUF4241 domain-containing protein [Thermomonospora cellulosilytica]MBA9003102.1 hypothetical protein [Thermomonospora cellulosilytica]
MLQPPDFDPMFRVGTRYRWDDDDPSVIDVQPVGELYLPSGRLIAQDPGWGAHPRVAPFTVTVPPGRYPVTLSISHWERSSDPDVPSPLRVVNAAKLTVRDEPAVSWELALLPGQNPAGLQDGEFFGFGVDSGTGCFLDASALTHLDRMSYPRHPALHDAMRNAYKLGGTDLPTDDPDLNIIVFSCGMGDGAYPTWIGRTATGDIACFISDLELLHHSLGPETP